jgi:hypothetical protein
MKQTRKHGILLFLTIISLAFPSCGLNLKESHDIKTNGFITESCYQAILEIEPEEGSRGLVARRESAFLKAKNVNVKDLAIQNLANYCIDSQLKTGTKDKNRNTVNQSENKNDFLNKVKGLVIGGSISFVYYNEKGSMIIGYRISRPGFRKKLAAIINPPVEQKQEAAVTTPGAKS